MVEADVLLFLPGRTTRIPSPREHCSKVDGRGNGGTYALANRLDLLRCFVLFEFKTDVFTIHSELQRHMSVIAIAGTFVPFTLHETIA